MNYFTAHISIANSLKLSKHSTVFWIRYHTSFHCLNVLTCITNIVSKRSCEWVILPCLTLWKGLHQFPLSKMLVLWLKNFFPFIFLLWLSDFYTKVVRKVQSISEFPDVNILHLFHPSFTLHVSLYSFNTSVCVFPNENNFLYNQSIIIRIMKLTMT